VPGGGDQRERRPPALHSHAVQQPPVMPSQQSVLPPGPWLPVSRDHGQCKVGTSHPTTRCTGPDNRKKRQWRGDPCTLHTAWRWDTRLPHPAPSTAMQRGSRHPYPRLLGPQPAATTHLLLICHPAWNDHSLPGGGSSCHSSSWEADAGESRVLGQPELKPPLPPRKKKKGERNVHLLQPLVPLPAPGTC
jgi:hypothetical protein